MSIGNNIGFFDFGHSYDMFYALPTPGLLGEFGRVPFYVSRDHNFGQLTSLMLGHKGGSAAPVPNRHIPSSSLGDCYCCCSFFFLFG